MSRFSRRTGAAVLAALCMAGARGASAQTYAPGVWIPVTNITAQSGGGAMELNWGDFRDLAGVQIYASPSLEPGRVDWQPLDKDKTGIAPLEGTENVYPLATVNAVIDQNGGQCFYRLRAVKEWQRVTWEKVDHTLRINLVTGEATKLPADYAVQFDPLCRSTNLYLRAIIPAGETFMMGSPDDEVGRYVGDVREKQHEVTLTKAFYIGVFEVTQRQWELVGACRASSDTHYAGDDYPRDYVRWDEVRGYSANYNWPHSTAVDQNSFMGLLRQKVANCGDNAAELQGILFDLPTEAQWEYACRAGTTTALNNGKELAQATGNNESLDEVAWYDAHIPGTGSYDKVGMLKGNAAGLHDMLGNMWEWCLDWWGVDITAPNPQVDPEGPPNSGIDHRIRRGGSWYSSARNCRSAHRGSNVPNGSFIYVGFRVAGTLAPQ